MKIRPCESPYDPFPVPFLLKNWKGLSNVTKELES